MQQLIYLEIPVSDTESVKDWLQHRFEPKTIESIGEKAITPDGFLVRSSGERELCVFVWSLQRTTYLKAFRWSDAPVDGEEQILQQLTQQIRVAFPYEYPEPPVITAELADRSIFELLADRYPLTVKYFQKFPNGEYDLNRAYWWEKRWRESVRNPQQPQQVIQQVIRSQVAGESAQESAPSSIPDYDLVYLGGALGVIHAAIMAKLGYRVCLIERLHFGRMNREWNISRSELEVLVSCGLLTQPELESLIQCEYVDGFNKFFDGNNPANAIAPILHTPTVLNLALDTSKLLQLCGDKLRQAGGKIIDQTEFERAEIGDRSVTVIARQGGEQIAIAARLLIDAMGSASSIAQQINYGMAFDSVCPTVGAVLDGLEPGVWDANFGDVLFSHGDISRGRQLIWELFPGAGSEVAVYLFHYHEVNKANPGSLLEMYEDFFSILPEYRRCDLDRLVWKKATFGYIPGQFSLNAGDRSCPFDRLLSIGDAAAMQSPLVFTGFGSLVRNLPRLTNLLDTALKHDLLTVRDLSSINAFQSNVAVTWLFSKGMMVPTGKHLPPERINSMLNTFFGVMTTETSDVSDRFIKDRLGWMMFNRMALKAAFINPSIIPWILEMAGIGDLLKWLVSYFRFTWDAIANFLLGRWLPRYLRKLQGSIEPRNPRLWLKLLSWSYALNYSIGKPESTPSTPSQVETSS